MVDDGAVRVARIAAEEGVGKLVHVSALGADIDSPSVYAHAKGKAEAGIREAFPTAVILRPSILFGDGDGFFNRFAGMARMSPIVPVIGPDTRFQPAYVDDVAAAAVTAVTTGVRARHLRARRPGGPEFRALIGRTLAVIRRRRLVVTVPWGSPGFQAGILDRLQRWTGGLFTNSVLTRDQVKLLRHDNVVSPGAGASPSSASPRPRWRRCWRATSTPTGRAASTPRSRNPPSGCGPDPWKTNRSWSPRSSACSRG